MTAVANRGHDMGELVAEPQDERRPRAAGISFGP